MTRYNLTAEQEALLSTLVRLTKEGKLSDPIVPIPVKDSQSGRLEFVLHLKGENSFYFKSISDLDVFCDFGLMTFRWNRQGIGKLYSLTGAGTAAVEDDFEKPFTPPGPKYRPDLIVRAMTGHLDANRTDRATPTVNQIAADPILLHTIVETLVNSLLEAVHQELRGPELIAYSKMVDGFKDAIYSGRLTRKELQAYARQLTGLDPDAHFLLKAWPYLYPLFLIAEKRLSLN